MFFIYLFIGICLILTIQYFQIFLFRRQLEHLAFIIIAISYVLISIVRIYSLQPGYNPELVKMLITAKTLTGFGYALFAYATFGMSGKPVKYYMIIMFFVSFILGVLVIVTGYILKENDLFFSLYNKSISLYLISTLVLVTFYFFKQKNQEKKMRMKRLMIFLGYLMLLVTSLLSYDLVPAPEIMFQVYIRVYIPLIIGVVFFSQALAYQFDQDHKDLIALTNTLEQKVDDRTRELARANESKVNFFINFAHETKTPLSIIKNSLVTLRKNPKNEDSLMTIDRMTDKLTTDVTNFLDTARIENDQQLYIHDRAIDLGSFVRSHITLRKEAADNNNITLIGHIKSKLIIKSNIDAVNRLLDNLIGNALKYTDKGSVIVDLLRDEEKVKLVIRDTGIGIKPESLPHIFEPLFRGELAVKACKEGQGNGLGIVKNIVDSLQGYITVESEAANGTIVTVTFPEYIPQADEKIEKSIVYSSPKTQNRYQKMDNEAQKEWPRLLIVDDNADMLQFLEDELSFKYQITTAINGQDGLKKLEATPCPDAIICDRMMPVMDGDDFFQATRAEYSKVPFFFLTAKNENKDKIEALHSGVVEYLSKPFNILELIGKLDAQIALQANNGESKVPALDDGKYDDVRAAILHYADEYNLQGQMIEILILLIMGKKIKAIAEELQTSENSISQQKKRIFERLPVKKENHKRIDRYDLARVFKII